MHLLPKNIDCEDRGGETSILSHWGYLVDSSSRRRFGPGTSDYGFVRRGFHRRSQLEEAVEEFSARAGLAAVEAECKFIQVVIQVFWADSPLVGSQQPALQRAATKCTLGHNSVADCLLRRTTVTS